jgi:tRNA(Arg) A34 adenosine deaminase TadA
MSAIRDAARRSNRCDLGNAVNYSSSQPGAMCEAAAYWANIGQMTYGREITSAAGNCTVTDDKVVNFEDYTKKQ